MAWYPGAEKMELQPESDAQPAITPTQVIFHSVAAPWTPRRMFEYWRDSTNLESHFGVGYNGAVGQFVGTETRADANMGANRRGDGTGAVSIETASDDHHTDPWTPLQLAALILLGAWLARRHGIPVRVCPSWDAPGFGYHRMFPQWSNGGTACPGDARARQFHDIVLPGIERAAAAGQPPVPSTPTAPAPAPAPSEEDDMPLTDADLARIRAEVSAAVTSQDVRDTVAYAVWYKLREQLDGTQAAVADLPSQVWNHRLPRVVRQADGSWVTDGTDQEAYWWIVWQDPFQVQLLEAIGAAALTPDELRQALTDGTLRVQVTVAPAAAPQEG
ncbi:peptidoglycan recognition protein family protein [Kitasatospora purpeofusca]|uniref:peptidoglycan recognition protein family protein n=1 Tax=Kitasatospora purpeofusca TaxID=67352 RepID=UPI00382B470F